GTDDTGTALPAANISGSAGEVASNLSAGDYAVKAINNTTGCVTIKPVIIADDKVLPIVTTTVTDNSVCDPVLGSTSFTGRIVANVSYRGATVTDLSNYTFTWYAGGAATGTPIASGKNLHTLENQNGGTYTVVVTNDAVSCESNPVYPVIRNVSVPPVVTAVTNADKTSCDAANPNGQ